MSEKKSKKKEKLKEILESEPMGDTGKLEKRDDQGDKKTDKREKKDIEKELIEIYKDPNGELPDMSKIYRKKRSRAKMVLICLAVFFAFLAALSWAGFFLFGSEKTFSGEKVSLEISAPEAAAGGEKIEYAIKYQNNESVPLGQAELEIRYPDDFIFQESDPSASEGQNLWKLGSLAAGKNGEIKIKGSSTGALGSLQTLQAVLTYKPADFNSEFQKVATAVTKIGSSNLTAEINGPARVLAKAETAFKIKYKNTAAEPLQNIKISVVAPEDFAFTVKEGEKEVTSWDVTEILPSEEKELEFKGSFGEKAEGKKEFKVQIGFSQKDNFYLQKESIFETEVIQGFALLNLIVNGDTKDRPVNFGDTLNYSIAYQNKGKADLEDLEIKITLESTSRNNKMMLDWATLEDDRDGIVLGSQISPESRQGTITWTKRQVAGLAKLAAGGEGMINFRIKVKPYSDLSDWNVKDFQIKSSATVKIGKIGEETKEETVESNPIVFKLNSDLSLETQARYFNDDNIAVGSGPLPPEVGQTTAYRIFWKVKNSLHEVQNLKVSIVLPENIKWSNKSEIEAGEINFNEKTREVIWTLNRMPVDVKSLGVNFEVTVTPAEAEKGKLLTLLLSTNLEASDKSTEGVISLTVGALTSNLDGDPMAEGKGVVR